MFEKGAARIKKVVLNFEKQIGELQIGIEEVDAEAEAADVRLKSAEQVFNRVKSEVTEQKDGLDKCKKQAVNIKTNIEKLIGSGE